MDLIKNIAVPVTRKRTAAAAAAKPRPAGRPTPPADSHVGGMVGAGRRPTPVMAATDKPIRVVENGVLLGVVDRARILAAVADTLGDRILGTMAGAPDPS